MSYCDSTVENPTRIIQFFPYLTLKPPIYIERLSLFECQSVASVLSFLQNYRAGVYHHKLKIEGHASHISQAHNSFKVQSDFPMKSLLTSA